LKCADALVLLATVIKVVQGMIDGLIEIRRCYGVETNVEKLRWWHIKATIHITDAFIQYSV
jgi:hypothetical protein